MDFGMKGALRRICIVLIASMLGLFSYAQPYKDEIASHPEKAGGVYSSYVVPPESLTKAPKGYKPFYISHYGRHGSRYHLSLIHI